MEPKFNLNEFPLENDSLPNSSDLLKSNELRFGAIDPDQNLVNSSRLENTTSKQAAVYAESTTLSEEFDIVLLHSMEKRAEATEAYRKSLKNASSVPTDKKHVKDLSALLISCAQAIAAEDCRGANDLLKQIRQHSSPFGDGNQRLANCFADGLEARLVGTGNHIYKALVDKRTSGDDILKAYHLYLSSCPYSKISNFVSNKTIMTKAEKATKVHIIDFGILYGFQWPAFIQHIAFREGGPPKLRITGIEFPQPGFRPS